MTRQEVTGTRDLGFSRWVRANLPDSSTGFLVSDLDFILWNNKTRNLMLIEVKTRRGHMRRWQARLFQMLDDMIKKAAQLMEPPVKYHGFHCVRFEGVSFADGRVLFDDKLVTEQELASILSMQG